MNQYSPVISVYHQGKPVLIDDDGYLHGLTRNDNVLLVVEPNDRRVLGITVDRNKAVTALPLHPSPRFGKYQLLITVPAPYFGNHLRLLRMDGEGRLTVDEVAVVSQGKHFFQTMQRIYDVQCYRDDHSSVIIPRFCFPFTDTPWPQLMAFVDSHVSNATFRRLPHIRNYRPESTVQRKLHIKQAEVVWYNLARRLGLVRTGIDVHAFVMGCDVPQNGTRHKYLEAGQIIKYTSLQRIADEDDATQKVVGISF